jgi:Tol biopolymer transport system component
MIRSDAWPSPISPDGSLVRLGNAEDGQGALIICSLKSGAEWLLSQRAMVGSWSPDEAHVAFTYYRDDPSDPTGLGIVSVDGSERLDLVEAVRAGSAAEFAPTGLVTWSAGGTQVAVENSADGKLYAIRLDGADVRQVESHFSRYVYSDGTAVSRTTWRAAKSVVRKRVASTSMVPLATASVLGVRHSRASSN